MISIQSKKISADVDEFHSGVAFAENGLFIVLEVEGTEKNHASVLGKKILDTILTHYTNYHKRDRNIVAAMLDLFTDTLSIKTLLIGLQEDTHLFIGCKGSGDVWMKRGEKTGNLITGEELISGDIKVHDQILFCSATFSQFMSKADKEALLTNDHFDIKGGSMNPGAVALLLSISSPQVRQLPFMRHLSSFFHTFATYVKSKESRSKKILLAISGILIFLLMVNIFLNVHNNRKTQQEKKLSETLSLVSHQYEEAVSLIDLNPSRARSLLSDSKLTLSPLLSRFGKNSNEQKEITEWLTKIAEQEVVAYKIYKLTSVPLFFDIELVKSGGEGDVVASYKEKKVILDTKNHVIYSLSTDKKQAVLLSGSETVKDAKSIALHGNTTYIVTDEGVVGIDIPTKVAKVVIPKDEQWGEIGAISSFGGNIYLLDKTKHAIWKYIATDFGFSSRTSYLNPDVRVNLGESKKLIIDGSVWVLFESELFKFSRGLREQFAFSGFSDTIAHIKMLSTSDEDKNLYLLDPNLSRIVVFDKDGTYQAQYQWDELKNAQDIVASEEEHKIFILIGSKIYAIEIK